MRGNQKGDSPTPGSRGSREEPRCGESPFRVFSPENLKKVIPPRRCGGITSSAFLEKPNGGESYRAPGGPGRNPVVGESPFRFSAPSRSREDHVFGLKNAEKVILPHLAPSWIAWSPVWGNHLFEVFRPENAEKMIPPHLGYSLDPLEPGVGESLF